MHLATVDMEAFDVWKQFIYCRVPAGFVSYFGQKQSERRQQLSVAHIAQLEREAIDSSDTHLALAAQHESTVPSLHRTATACMGYSIA